MTKVQLKQYIKLLKLHQVLVSDISVPDMYQPDISRFIQVVIDIARGTLGDD